MFVEIQEYLLQNGFVQDENKFIKQVQQKAGEMIVNGHRQIQVRKVEIAIEFIGDGYEQTEGYDKIPLTQWNLHVNDEDHGDFLIHDVDEFKQIFKK